MSPWGTRGHCGDIAHRRGRGRGMGRGRTTCHERNAGTWALKGARGQAKDRQTPAFKEAQKLPDSNAKTHPCLRKASAISLHAPRKHFEVAKQVVEGGPRKLGSPWG